MQENSNLKSTPMKVVRSTRLDEKRILTSGFAGKILPLAMVPILREDGIKSSRMDFIFEMAETAKTLMNAVNIQVNAYFVPYLAFERFNGMDALNRSYSGEPETSGGVDVIPFIEQMNYGLAGENEIYQTLGLHAPALTTVNGSVMEAYNTMVNFRRKQRSKSLPMLHRHNHLLADSFWRHTQMKHIVPDFDQVGMEGNVPLSYHDGMAAVTGLGIQAGFTTTNQNMLTTTGNQVTDWVKAAEGQLSSNQIGVAMDGTQTWPAVFAELEGAGVTVSLANIEMAKKTQAFAEVRKDYQGYDDDYIIDLLMSGIRVPETILKQPILLAQKNTIYGYQERYATDAQNLDVSATRGESRVSLNLRMPPMNTGGIVYITAEISPEQLFERQKDYFFYTRAATEFPEYVRDYLDPEKVAHVNNNHVDTEHTDPYATFGYAPLNHQYMRHGPNVGGKYYRPNATDEFSEDRQKIWSVETVDPELTTDFYLCTDMHHKVFADTSSDPFEITGRGVFQITGNTVFGPKLRESAAEYLELMGQTDHHRLTDVPSTPTEGLPGLPGGGGDADQISAETGTAEKGGETT